MEVVKALTLLCTTTQPTVCKLWSGYDVMPLTGVCLASWRKMKIRLASCWNYPGRYCEKPSSSRWNMKWKGRKGKRDGTVCRKPYIHFLVSDVTASQWNIFPNPSPGHTSQDVSPAMPCSRCQFLWESREGTSVVACGYLTSAEVTVVIF